MAQKNEGSSTQVIIVSLMLKDLIDTDGAKHDGKGLLARIRQCFLLKSIIAAWAQQQLVKLMALDQVHDCRRAQKHAKEMQDGAEDDEAEKKKAQAIEDAIIKYLKAADTDRATASEHIQTIVTEGKKHVDELRKLATDKYLPQLLETHDIKLSDDLQRMLSDGAASLSAHEVQRRLTERSIPLPAETGAEPGLFTTLYQLAIHLQGNILSTAASTATPTPEDVLALDREWEKCQETMAGKITTMIQASNIEAVEDRGEAIERSSDTLDDMELAAKFEKKNN